MTGYQLAPPLLSGWSLIINGLCYFIIAVFASIAIRAILAIFKALATADGEHLNYFGKEDAPDEAKELQDASWLHRAKSSFRGFGGPPEISASVNDYWLPTIIGIAELMSYPVFLATDNITVIGAWIAIKTAGQWRVWEKSRTAFNRFLVGNILVLFVSYFCLAKYVIQVAAESG